VRARCFVLVIAPTPSHPGRHVVIYTEQPRSIHIGFSPYIDAIEGNAELLRIETIDVDLEADQRAESILNGTGPNVIAGQCRWLVHDERVLAGAHGRGHGTDTGTFDGVGQLRRSEERRVGKEVGAR